jgi:hypothetical protein
MLHRRVNGHANADDNVAGVVELVDAPDSKSGSERSVGSIPTARTILFEYQQDPSWTASEPLANC